MEEEMIRIALGPVAELKKNPCQVVRGKNIAVFIRGNRVYCFDNACTHLQGPLCQGEISTGKVKGGTNHLPHAVIECPWHGSQFDMNTGKVVRGPATLPVKT